MSISNVVSALKLLNMVPAEDVTYCWPSDLDAFSKPWERKKTMGVTSMRGIEPSIPDDVIEPFSKEDISRAYEEGRISGGMQFSFDDSELTDTG